MNDQPGAALDPDELARRMQLGEPDSYPVFADAFGDRLRRAFLARGLSPHDAEFLAETALGDIVIKIDQFKDQGPGSFFKWANTVAFNLLRDEIRSRRFRVSIENWDELADPSSRSVGADLDAPRLRELLDAAVRQLSADDQKIFFAALADPDDYAAKIGKEVDLEPGNVRVRFKRAKERLEKILKDEPAVRVWREQLRSKGDEE